MSQILGPIFIVYILTSAILFPMLSLSLWIEKRDCELINAPLSCAWEVVPQEPQP